MKLLTVLRARPQFIISLWYLADMRRYIPFLFLLASCTYSADSLYTSPIPSIEHPTLELIKATQSNDPDTLKLRLLMKDGDGDLGVNSNLTPQDNYANAFLKATGAKVDLATLTSPELRDPVIQYHDRKMHPYDTLPAFTPPYDCRNWYVTGTNGRIDTVYIQKNINFFNIQVTLLLESATGTYEPFDFGVLPYGLCTYNLSGRFPEVEFLDTPSSVRTGLFQLLSLSPSATSLTYNIPLYAYQNQLWQSKKAKLRVSVMDRKLHRSNIIETGAVQL
jgi:hypothetical protein